MAALRPPTIVQVQHLPHVTPNSETGNQTIHRLPRNDRKIEVITMAYVNTTRAASVGFSDRISAMVASMKTALQRRKLYNQTVRELSALSSRDLADLGISRSMITRLALEAAYGK